MTGSGTDDDFLVSVLAERLHELRGETGLTAWQAWNARRETARKALEAAERRGDLP